MGTLRIILTEFGVYIDSINTNKRKGDFINFAINTSNWDCSGTTDQLAEMCVTCGVNIVICLVSSKSKITTAVLCIVLGWFGVHRFYVGKIGTGLIQLFTFCCYGIWAIIDLINLLHDKFEDKDGKIIKN